ncbi:uncharacterized mitochondrial protein AtMg00810-like [Tripterygium wilfordii]|uniref:uncharacterized mitochondrial protein AtMg00810-like n=1 Tax=Tripterygium wilfordii TaxID=458696 RepID=UPI0018F85815|nr:uncharacterized mitochondrial protein AtMg00810-like [Tripterygium wilfordii]
MDIHSAFINGDLTEEVYMKQPPRYPTTNPDLVCWLHKSLYGLKQVSRQWNAKFSSVLLAFGFRQSKCDYSLFTLRKCLDFIVLLLYVDDMVIGRTCEALITSVKLYLHECFNIKDLGAMKYFLGLEICSSSSGLILNQRKYTLDLLHDAGFLNAKPLTSPTELNTHISIHSGTSLDDPSCYHQLIGRLMYLTLTRLNINYIVNNLSQFLQQPSDKHLQAAHCVLRYVLRYLKGSPRQGLFFLFTHSFELHAFCNSDWGGYLDSHRFVSGFCIILGGSLVSWKSKKQHIVSLSSAEVEYRAMPNTYNELVWLSTLLTDFYVPHSRPIPLHCDSKVAIHIGNNLIFHEHTKHIEMDCHVVHEKVHFGFLQLLHISSTEQPSDLLTKPIIVNQIQYLLCKLNVLDAHRSPCGGC